MRLSYRLTNCFIVLGVFAWTTGLAQATDSLKARLAFLQQARQEHLLKDTDYLRSVDSVAPLLEQEDSLPEWLSTYRDIAFSDPHQAGRRASYYTYMALAAYNANKFGSAVYYSEKNNQAKINAGLFEFTALSHADLFALTVYYNSRNYPRVLEKYLQLRKTLAGIPQAIARGEASPEQVWLALSILQTAVYTYCKMGDSALMEGSFGLTTDILEKIGQHPSNYKALQRQFDYLADNMAFERQSCIHHPQDAARFLQAAIEAVRSKEFPANLVSDYSGSLYMEAVDFYFDLNKPDSARYYLNLLSTHGPNDRFAVSDPVFLLEGNSRLQAGSGHNAEAYSQLRKAWLLRDSAYYAVSSDRDNNLYALAEAENTRAELLRSEEAKRSADKINLLLFFLVFLLVLGGGAALLINRSRQHRRLLDLQLHLARNFHDAVGPMLLYANALVTKEIEDQPRPRLVELKGHIGQIMEEVRSISHDLKSNRFGTITDFGHEMTALLEKVRGATGMGFTLKVDDGDRALSHLQLSNLSRIMRELVGNSIKHAGCNQISLEMIRIKKTLQVSYSDDGKGMDPDTPGGGIGLKNVQERVASMKGDFRLNNTWPQGYSIQIMIPLL